MAMDPIGQLRWMHKPGGSRRATMGPGKDGDREKGNYLVSYSALYYTGTQQRQNKTVINPQWLL